VIRSNGEAIIQLKNQMLNEFEMSNLGELSYFFGIEFTKTRHNIIMH